MTPRPTRLTLPVPPSANEYWRSIGLGQGRVRVTLSKAARQYRTDVLARCRVAGVRPIAGPVEVGIIWHRDRQAGDLDNRIKPLLDALKKIAFGDDRFVYRLVAEIAPPDNSGPRVEVTVTPYVATPIAAPSGDRRDVLHDLLAERMAQLTTTEYGELGALMQGLRSSRKTHRETRHISYRETALAILSALGDPEADRE